MNLNKVHSTWAADKAVPSQNNKKQKNNDDSALINAIGGMIEMAKAMIAVEHGVMPETDDVNPELEDHLKNSGIDALEVWGDMNPNAVTKDETYDDAFGTNWVAVKTKDSDVVCSEMSFVKRCSVEGSILVGCTSSDGEPGMSSKKIKENEAHDEAVPLGCGDGNGRGGDYNMNISKAFSGSEVIKPTGFQVSIEAIDASPRDISDAEEVHKLSDFLLNGKGGTERINHKMNAVNKKPGSKSMISSGTKYAGFLSKWMIPFLFICFLSGGSFAAILFNAELSEDEEGISKASILDHLVTDSVTEPSSLLDKGVEKHDVSNLLDLDQTSLEEVVTDTAVEPGNVLDRSTEMINELSQRLLRGGRDINSVREISNVKDIITPLLERIQNIRRSYNSGDKEKAASALKAFVGDTTVISSSLSESSETPTSIQLRDVPDAQLLEFIEPQVLKQLDENAQELLAGIDDAVPNLKKLSASKRKKRSFQTQKESSRSNQRFFASSPSEFGHNGGGAYSASHQSYAKYFKHHQHIHRFLKDDKTGRTDSIFSSLHRHPFFSKHSDTIMTKHQLRLEALGEEVCAPVCKPDDWQCNCKKLFSCVSDMTEYSLSVLIAGGFIETDPMSNNFGNFTLSADAMNLFDAEEGVTDKLKRIKVVAEKGATMDNCKAVLSDLFTACDSSKGICTDPNIETFAVSTNQVCQVVNTPIKLKFETVWDEFDESVDDSLPATLEPLSFELCKDFVVHFDRLYIAYDDFTVKRVKLQQTTGEALNVWEVEIFDSTGTNVAKGKTATASSVFDNEGPERAVDGDLGTLFHSNDSRNDANPWLNIDLGASCRGCTIVIHNRGCGTGNCDCRLSNANLMLYDDSGGVSKTINVGNTCGRAILKYALFDLSPSTNPMRKDPHVSLWDKTTISIFNHVQFPVNYWFPQDHRGVINRMAWSATNITSSFSIVNPESGKALTLAGTACDEKGENATIELKDHDPSNPRQHFRIKDDGKIFSAICPKRWFWQDKASFTDPPPEYIKQVKLQQTTGDFLNVFEVQVFDSTGTNVAKGKTATASSVYSNNEGPERAVDGDLRTLFHSKSKNDGDANAWLNIDLGASCRGCTIVIHNRWCHDASDSRENCFCRLSNANLMLYDDSGTVVKTINVGNTCGRAILKYDMSSKRIDMFLSTTDVKSAESCTSGGLLQLQKASGKGQQWRMGANGRIILNTNCQQYKVGGLAISAIKDDDIENMIDANMYVSIVNPSSGMAISIESCDANATVKFNPFNKDETKQRFKLIRSGEKLIIQSKHCEIGKASVLSLRGCASEASGIMLGPREVCIRATTSALHSFFNYWLNKGGYVNIYVDSGDGYKLQTVANKFWSSSTTVLEKCYDDYRGVQVQAIKTEWYGTVQISTDGKKTWDDMICMDGCVNQNTMPILVTPTEGVLKDITTCQGKNVCTLAPKYDVKYNRVWKIGGGSIENDECGTVAGIPGLNFPPSSGGQITVADDEERWNQKWQVIAHEAVLLTENNGPYQEWKAHFIDPPYDFALLPGFPLGLGGTFEDKDIGAVGIPGDTTEITSDDIIVTGSGSDIYGISDQFHYHYKSGSGYDSIEVLATNFVNGREWAKGGVMFRETLDAGSKHFSLFLTGNMGMQQVWRESTNGSSDQSRPGINDKNIWLRIERTGNEFQAYYKKVGTTSWVPAGQKRTIQFSKDVYVGIAVTSLDNNKLATFEGSALELGSFPGYVTRVKLQQTTGEALNVFEVQVFDSTGTNVAKGKTATASSVFNNEGPERAVDGDLGTLFHSKSRNDNPGDANPWLNIDLGTSCRGCTIVIHNRGCGTGNCDCRLSNANLMLYDDSGGVAKTINVGNTCGRAILKYGGVGLPPPPEPEIAKTAMNRCDESMALLVGSQTSSGALKAIADLVTSEGPDRMPGQCCFDTPSTNDKYLGVDYDPKLMACKNKGPFHLGISEEACENAGGKWFRTPCITLKKTVDQRPPRFNMKSPKQCQDASPGQMNLAYVALSFSQSPNFSFEHTDHGCLEFCRTLPGYSNQRAMMTISIMEFVQVKLQQTTGEALNVFEVQVFDSTGTNVAKGKTATASSVFNNEGPERAVDGDLGTLFHSNDSRNDANPWLNIDLGASCRGCTIVIHNRRCGDEKDSGGCFCRLSNANLMLYDVSGTVVKTINVGNTCGRAVLKYDSEHTGVSTCVCLYEDGLLPKAAELPEFATRSPPAFYFTDSDGGSLGIPLGYDCTANEIPIEYQRNATSTRCQFQLSYDHQLVNAACPNKALVADCARNRLALSDSQTGAVTWLLNKDGSITNAKCPNLKLSSTKNSINVLASNYFSLVNPITGLVMGIEDMSKGCVNGMNIVLQNAEEGNPNQLFFMKDGSGEIISLACPKSALSVSDASKCDSSTSVIQLKTSVGKSIWQFNNDTTIQSISQCKDKVIDVMTTGTNLSDINSLKDLRGSSGKYTVTMGTSLVISNYTEAPSMYQKWVVNRQQFTILSGPYSFVDSKTGLAMSLADDTCAVGTALKMQADSYNDKKQNFYLGSSGAIYSVLCPGLEVTASGAGSQLTLQSVTREDNPKWNFLSDGSIESIKKGNKVEIVGSSIILGRTYEDKDIGAVGVPGDTTITGDDIKVTGSGSDIWLASDQFHYHYKSGSGYDSIEVLAKNFVGADQYAKGGIMFRETLDRGSKHFSLFLTGSYGMQQVWRENKNGTSFESRPGIQDKNIWLRIERKGNEFQAFYKRVGTTSWVPAGAKRTIQMSNDVYVGIAVTSRDNSKLATFEGSALQPNYIPKWNKINTRLLTTDNISSGKEWNQNWKVYFVEAFDRSILDQTYDIGSVEIRRTCYTVNEGFSPSFEDFARGLVIDDASDEDQCRKTRELLGYDRDYPYDTEVRDRFNDKACGIDHTAVDHMMLKPLAEPPAFTEIEFEAPEYPDDPELTFDTLPTHTFQMPELYSTGKSGWDSIQAMEDSSKVLGEIAKYAQMYYESAKDAKEQACNVLPHWYCTPVIAGFGGCVYFPFRTICEVTGGILVKLAWLLARVAEVAIEVLDKAIWMVEKLTATEEFDAPLASVATLENLASFDTYVQDSLNIINKNIFTQHSEMRGHLQDRHQAMTNDIVGFIEESTNTISDYFTLQTNWLHENLCTIYKALKGTCTKADDMLLLSKVGLHMWDKMLQIEEQGVSLMKMVETSQIAYGSNVSQDEEGDANLQSTHSKFESVLEKVDAVEMDMKMVKDDLREIKDEMQEMKDEMQEMKRKIDSEMQEMKEMMSKMEEMMSKMLGMMAK